MSIEKPLTELSNLDGEEVAAPASIADQVSYSLQGAGLPSDKAEIVMSQLRHETGLGNLESNVARENNNVSGITWNKNFPEEWKGTARPKSEGGNYVRFPTYGDWAKEHLKLLKKDSGAGAPIDAADIPDFAHRLKKNGYYRDPESVYVAGMTNMHSKYGNQRVATPKSRNPGGQLVELSNLDGEEVAPSQPQPTSASPTDEDPSVMPGEVSESVMPGQPQTNPAVATPQVSNQQQPTQQNNQVDVEGSLTKTDPITGMPIIPFYGKKGRTAEDVKAEFADATNYVSQDILKNIQNLPPDYKQNVNSVGFQDPNSVLHATTDPHGDPARSATYLRSRMEQIQKEREIATQEAYKGDKSTVQLKDIQKPYDDEMLRLKNSVDHIMDLQLTNQSHAGSLDESQTKTALDAAKTQHEKRLAEIDKHNEDSKWHDIGIGALKLGAAPVGASGLVPDYKGVSPNQEIERYNKEVADIHSKSQHDPVEIGMQKAKLFGDGGAEDDIVKYRNGKAISPERKLSYQMSGLGVLQNAKSAALANGQDAVAEKIGKYSDHAEEILERDNPEILRAQRINQIAQEADKDNNRLHGIVYSRNPLKQEELERYAKNIGMSKKDIKDIKPEDIPTVAGPANHIVQGFVNTLGSPAYELGMRGAVKLGIANEDAVNRRFHTGWPEESDLGHLFTGDIPEYQRHLTLSNPRSVVASMSKGVGDLAGFLAGGEILKGLGTGEKMANFASAAIPSYNSAYEKSLNLFGDKPEDEGKRQKYSILNGLIGGAVMMIDPKADIARDILGETKAGKGIIDLIAKKDLGDITKGDLKDRLVKVLSETASHVGLQTSIPALQTAAGNVTDMIMDSKHPHGVFDNVADAAVGGAIGMLIPSLAAGIHAPGNQTRMNKALLWDMGMNTKKYTDEVGALYSSGKMSRGDANIAIANIAKAKNIIQTQLPQATIEGKELSPDQQQDYVWSLLKSDDLQNRLQKAEATNDKAQIDQVKGLITAEDKLRTDLLKKAGDVPKIEKPVVKEEVPEVTAEPSVPAPKEQTPSEIAHEIVQQVVREHKEKNNTDKSKENVSLGSETISSTKKDENESINVQNGRQSSPELSETTGSEKEADIRQTASLEGQQDRQGRELTKPEFETENTGGAESKQTPPEPVSGKKKRYKFVEEETVEPAEAEKPEITPAEPTNEQQPPVEKQTAPEKVEAISETKESKEKKEQISRGINPESTISTVKMQRDPTERSKPGDSGDRYFYVTEDIAKKAYEAYTKHERSKGDPRVQPYERIMERGGFTAMELDQLHPTWKEELHAAEMPTPEPIKSKSDASIQSEKQHQEGSSESRVKEHARTEQAGSKEAPTGPEGGDSNQRGKKEEVKAPDVIHTGNGTYVKPGENAKPGSIITYEKGGKTLTGKVSESPVKRNANKDLIGTHKITQVTNAHKMSFGPFNAKKNELGLGNNKKNNNPKAPVKRSFEPQTFEEEVLAFLANGGKFKETKNFHKHIAPEGSTELKEARAKWIAKEDEVGVDPDQFSSQFAEREGIDNKEGFIGEILTRHKTIEPILDHLLDIHRQREMAEEGINPNEAKVSFEVVDHETGDTHKVEFDANDPELDHKIAEFLGEPNENTPTAFTEEGHPIYDRGLSNEEAISDHKLSGEDSNRLYDVLGRVTDENGKINEDKLFNEAQVILRDPEASPELKALLEDIVPFAAPEQNTPSIEKIRKSVTEYEQSKATNTEREATAATEGGAGERPTKAPEQSRNAKDSGSTGSGEEAETRAHQARIKEIDLQLQKERAAQKIEYEKGKALASKVAKRDGPAIEQSKIHQKNWDKKQAKIEKLLQDKEDIEREESIRGTFSGWADRMEEKYNRNKAAHKGITTSSGILGLSHKIGDHVADFIVARVLEGVRKFGNLAVAVDRGIRLAKEKFGTDAEKLSYEDAKTITENIGVKGATLDHPPALSLQNEEAAKMMLADIKSGIPYEEVMAELRDDEISDELKAKIRDYIEWKIDEKSGSEKTSTGGATPPGKTRVESHKINESDFSRYLGSDTTLDIFGEEGFFDDANEKKVAVRLEKMTEDARAMTEDYRDNGKEPSAWGAEMLSDIKAVKDNPKRQGIALAGLHLELQQERMVNEQRVKELDKAIATEKDATKLDAMRTERNVILKEQNKLQSLISSVQNFKKKLLSTASDVLQSGRLDRLMRDDIMSEYYQAKILSDAQIKNQKKMEDALNKSIVEDYKNHPQYKKDLAKKEAEKSKGRAKSESTAERMKRTKNRESKVSDKQKKEASAEKQKAMSEFPRNEKGDVMTPEEFVEHLKKLKRPC